MPTITKPRYSLIAKTVFTHGTIEKVKSTEIALNDSDLWARVTCKHGFLEASANTNSGAFVIQISSQASGNDDWATVASHRTFAGTPASTTLNEVEPIGETTLLVADASSFGDEEWVLIEDNNDRTTSEFRQLAESTTSPTPDELHLVDGLTAANEASDRVWSDAEVFTDDIELAGAKRIRVVYIHTGTTGADTFIEADIVVMSIT